MTEGMEIRLKLADVPFSARVLYSETAALCSDYLTQETPLFSIEIMPERIEREQKELEALSRTHRGIPSPSIGAETESNALYRETAERLSAYHTILMHGSAVAVDGEGYVFVAPSGTGKSTHTSLWREVFGNRAIMVNDDKPLIRCADAGVFICGSPWNGKHHLSSNVKVPLKAVCFLHRGKENRIETADGSGAYLAMLKSVYRSDDVAKEQAILRTLKEVFERVSCYRLYCNMEKEAALVAYEGMSNGNAMVV